MERNISKKIGFKLRGFFESQEMSQQDVAYKFNTDQSRICRIYNGDFTARSRIAREMCLTANIDFTQEKKLSKKVAGESKDVNKLALKLNRLSVQDRKSISKLTRLLKELI